MFSSMTSFGSEITLQIMNTVHVMTKLYVEIASRG